MMRIFLSLVLVVAVLGMGSGASGQSVPAELQGIYSGTVKLTSYETGTPVKLSGVATVTMGASEWELLIVGGEGSSTFDGDVAAVGPFIFGSASDSASMIGGRMVVKGKPGKQSLSGKLTFGYGPFLGVGDVTLKVKKLGM